jgi:LysM repeat protein
VSRRQVVRFAAPAAFLAGVTIAVLLIRAGLNGPATTTTTSLVPAPATTRTAATTSRTRTRTGTASAAAEYYTVESGDTFGSIASKNGTTVEQLEQLNPGVSSNALTVGQRIRVK